MSVCRLLLLCAVLFCCCRIGAALPFNPDVNVPRRCDISPDKRIQLFRDGRAQCRIVIPPDASPTVAFAAGELAALLKEAAGNAPEIKNAPAPDLVNFFLGDQEPVRAAGIDVASLPSEGFVIIARGRNIYIAGLDDPKFNLRLHRDNPALARNFFQRGTLTGVYDFLERFAGVRFYFPGELGTVVPPERNLAVPECNILERPDFLERLNQCWVGEWYLPRNYGRGMNFWRLRVNSRHIPFSHGLARHSFIARFKESNPDYFSLLPDGSRHNDPARMHPGQICMSGKVWQEVINDSLAYLQGEKAASRGIRPEPYVDDRGWSIWSFQPGMVDLMPQDGQIPCLCAGCSAYFRPGGKKGTNLVWERTVEAANAISKAGISAFVTNMAYDYYDKLPDVELPDNVLVSVATPGPWTHHFRNERAVTDKFLAGWRQKSKHRIFLRNYALNGEFYGVIPEVPAMFPRAIGRYYQDYAPLAAGAYLEIHGRRYIDNYLNCYVFSKVAWDNRSDAAQILAEHHKLMFGKAAVPMGRFFDRLEELWMTRVLGSCIQTPVGPVFNKPSRYEAWEKIYNRQEIAALAALFDEAAALTGKNSVEARRVAFFRKHLWEPIAAGSRRYLSEKNDLEDWIFTGVELQNSSAPVIDGKLDDGVWQTGATGELTAFGSRSDIIDVRTVFRMARDAKNLYVAIRAEEPHMAAMQYADRPFDDPQIYLDSSIELFLNPGGDRKHFWHIIVNPSGSVSDSWNERSATRRRLDLGANSGAQIKVGREANAWTVEMAIPLAAMPEMQKDKFPFNICRTRQVKAVKCNSIWFSYSPFLKGGFQDLENFGTVRFGGDKTDNLLLDADFTVTPQGRNFGAWFGGIWNIDTGKITAPGGAAALDDKLYITGGRSIRLTGTPQDACVYLQQNLPRLKPNTRYRFSCFLRLDNIKPVRPGGGVVFNLWDDKNVWFGKGAYTGSMPWTRQVYNFTTSAAVNRDTKAYLRLFLLNCQGRAWFDRVRLEEIHD